MYGAVSNLSAATLAAQPTATLAQTNPLLVPAAPGSVAAQWASSLAAAFQVRVQKTGTAALGKAQTDYNSCLEYGPTQDPNILFSGCVGPDPLSTYVGNAAMAEILNGNSQLHKDARAWLSSIASKYGASATQGLIGSFAAAVAPLIAPIGKTKADVVANASFDVGNAFVAWNNDLQVLAGVSQGPPPSLIAQKPISFVPKVVTSGGTSSTTPHQVTSCPTGMMPCGWDSTGPCPPGVPQGTACVPVIVQGTQQNYTCNMDEYRAPGTRGPDDPGCGFAACPPGTIRAAPGVCIPGQAIATQTPPTPSTLQKALPWLAGAAVLGGVVWWAGRR